MQFEKRMVYVLTAWYHDFENSGYDSPSEEFYAATLDEAELKKAELLEDPAYDDVWISDTKEERELLG